MTHQLFVLPFLAALIVVLAGMPLDIFTFNRREVGTAQVTPWQRRLSASLIRIGGLWCRMLSRLRSPGSWQLACATVLLVLCATHAIHPTSLVAVAGLTAAELREKANKCGVDMKTIMDKVRAENREDLTAEEATQFDRLNEERDSLLAKERRELAMASLEGTTGRRSEPAQPQQQPNPRPAQGEKRDLRDHSTVLRGFFAGSRRKEYVEAAQRCGAELGDSKSCFIALTRRPLASKRPDDVREWRERLQDPEEAVKVTERTEDRQLTSGVFSPDNTGHFALQPSEMLQALEIALLEYGGMRAVATSVRSDSGIPLPFPTMNDTSNEGAIIAETIEETTDVEPSFGQMVLHAFTYSSRKIPVSIEFMQDNGIGFEGRVGEILGTRIARVTNRHFTVGTGSGQPTGIVTAATSSGVTSASATGFIYDDIVNLEHSVDPAYRQRGPAGSKFMFNDATLLALKKIKIAHFSGDTGGWPLWRPGLTVGEPDTIDGYGYVINQHMPAPTAGLKSMIFGALNKYQIRDVRLIEILRLAELRAEFREVVWMAWYRGDGNLLDAGTHPVKYLTMHA